MTEWDPNDPDTVKVHYDVSAWSDEQRAELAEALADADIAHVWEADDGVDELVVPEEQEAVADELFGRLEGALGPFPIPLGDEPSPVEYGLDEWPPADRQTLTTAIVEAEVPHRWDGATLYVPAAAEPVVDELLDALEAGTLAVTGTDEDAPPDDALSRLFNGADRLAKDADDRAGRDDLIALAAILVANRAPYGVGGAAWSNIVAANGDLTDLFENVDAGPSDVIGAAQQLRSLVRQYV